MIYDDEPVIKISRPIIYQENLKTIYSDIK